MIFETVDDLEGCDITSQSIKCVGIHGGADPRLLRNRIHDGKMLASMWTTRARGRWRTTTSSATLFRAWKSRWSEERGDENGRSADSSPRRWSNFRSGSPALWKDPCWPSYRRAVGPTPEGRTRPSEAVADRGYSRNGERTEQSAPERKFCREGRGAMTFTRPARTPFKPEGKPSFLKYPPATAPDRSRGGYPYRHPFHRLTNTAGP